MSFSISVIIPTFNRAGLLPGALDSVIRQSRPADEIIIVDDGSTDRTAQLIGENYPQAVYIRQARAGVAAARNRGLSAAGGDWIAFLDSDDQWLPHKLEAQCRALTAAPEYRICHSNEIWIRRGRRVNPGKKHQKFGGFIYRHCLPLCVISPSAVLIHRSVFATAGVFDAALPVCEDYDLWLRICARYPVLYLEEPLITKYGGHRDQLSRAHWGMDRFRVVALEKMMADPHLSAADRAATREVLIAKLQILLKGAGKRGNDELAGRMRDKLHTYRSPLPR